MLLLFLLLRLLVLLHAYIYIYIYLQIRTKITYLKLKCLFSFKNIVIVCVYICCWDVCPCIVNKISMCYVFNKFSSSLFLNYVLSYIVYGAFYFFDIVYFFKSMKFFSSVIHVSFLFTFFIF